MGPTALHGLCATSAEGQGSLLLWLPAYAGIIAVFYFLLIAPTRRQQKERAKMIDALKPGDKIVTNGGIHGTVVAVSDGVLQVRIAEQVKIRLSKSAVAALEDADGAADS